MVQTLMAYNEEAIKLLEELLLQLKTGLTKVDVLDIQMETATLENRRYLNGRSKITLITRLEKTMVAMVASGAVVLPEHVLVV